MGFRNWIDVLKSGSLREAGQTMTEYAVVLGVITLGVITAVGLLALAISGKFGPVTAKIGSLP
jgi:Flp pilus assembly pilin Flp